MTEENRTIPAGAPVSSSTSGSPESGGAPEPTRQHLDLDADSARTDIPVVGSLLEQLNARGSEDRTSAIEPGPHRSNPIGILADCITSLPAAAVIVAATIAGIYFDEDASDIIAFFSGLHIHPGLGIAAGVVVYGLLAAAVGVISWLTHTWELTDTELILRSGVIVKRERRMPFQRIHSIDMKTNVVERLLGLTTLKVDTGAGDEGGNTIRSLTMPQAQTIKAEVFSRKTLQSKSRAVASGLASGHTEKTMDPAASQETAADTASIAQDGTAQDAPFEDEVTFERKLSRRQHLLASVTDFSVGTVLLTIVVALCTMSSFIGPAMETAIEQAAEGVFDNFFVRLFFMKQFHMLNPAQQVQSGIIIVLMVSTFATIASYLLGWVLSIVVAFFRYGDFQVRRRGSRIEVNQGLLNRTLQSIEVNRIQLVQVNQPFVKRLLGLAEIRVHTVKGAAGGNQGKNNQIDQGTVLHPCLKLTDVEAFLTGALPEYAEVAAHIAPGDSSLRPLPPVALRRTIVRGLLWSALVVVPLTIFLVWFHGFSSSYIEDFSYEPIFLAAVFGVLAAFLVIMFTVRVLAWRIRRVGICGRYLMMVDGGIERRVSAIHKTKVQSCTTRQTPFQRHSGVDTVKTRTACTYETADPKMRDVDHDYAHQILAWTRPRYTSTLSGEE